MCARTPVFQSAPVVIRVRHDVDCKLEKKPGSLLANVGAWQVFIDSLGGQTTTDGYWVNTTSILKLTTWRFELEPPPGLRAKTGDLSGALQ